MLLHCLLHISCLWVIAGVWAVMEVSDLAPLSFCQLSLLPFAVKCNSGEAALASAGEEKAGKGGGGGGSSKTRDTSFPETYKTSWSNHANLPPRLRHLANPK